jgi:protocatechuate 3,4-dioxygenase beta subunit
MNPVSLGRRQLLIRLASGLLVPALTGEAWADALQQTPWMTEGPFYPYRALPLDRDNDLLIVGNSPTPAVGAVTHLTGRILDTGGMPLRGATIEIWQTDGNGVYLASRGQDRGFDPNFQGYGRFETDATGAYRFRTIQPVVYPGRSAPHVHVKVVVKGRPALTTQLFVAGHPGNARDMVYRQLRGADARAAVTREFAPVVGSKIGERAVAFDIVVGATPQEEDHDRFRDRPRF